MVRDDNIRREPLFIYQIEHGRISLSHVLAWCTLPERFEIARAKEKNLKVLHLDGQGAQTERLQNEPG